MINQICVFQLTRQIKHERVKSGENHLLGHPLHLAGAGAGDVHLGHRVHHGVHDLLGEPADQVVNADGASSKRGMASMSGVGSDKISIAVFVLS